MTISNELSRNDYVAAGGGSYAYTFKILDENELKVYADNVLLTIHTDYNVYGVLDEAGGSVDFVVVPPIGTKIAIIDLPEFLQETDYIENDSFPASSHENALDKLTRLCLWLKNRLGQALLLPSTSTVTGLELPEPEANLFLKWNPTATALINSHSATTISDGYMTKEQVLLLESTPGGHAPATTLGQPVAIEGQTIRLINDAGTTITEVDTGVLADSHTVIPSSKAVKDAVSGAFTSGTISMTAPLVIDQVRQVIGGTAVVSMPAATTTTDGYMTKEQALALFRSPKGFQVTIKDSDELYIWGGSIDINEGRYYANGQITYNTGALAADTTYFVYVSEPVGTTTITDAHISLSTTTPTYNHAKGAEYNGANLFLAKVHTA